QLRAGTEQYLRDDEQHVAETVADAGRPHVPVERQPDLLTRAVTRKSLVLLAALLAACRTDPAPVPDGGARESPGEWFVDRASDTGLDFVHVNGMSGQF